MPGVDPAHNPYHSVKPPPRETQQLLQVSVVLWLLALPGVLALCLHARPHLVGSHLSPPVLGSMLAAQLALLLAGAALVGSSTAPRLGIPALLWSMWSRAAGWPVNARALVQYLWLPALGGGVLGAAWMVSLSQMTPGIYIPGNPTQVLPLWVKCLAAVPVALMVHWGAMSAVLFGLWRIFQPRGGTPRNIWIALSMLVSGLALGLAMVGLSFVTLGSLTPAMTGVVMLEYTLWGMIAGYIFWRYGLEAAMLAHMMALAFSHGLA